MIFAWLAPAFSWPADSLRRQGHRPDTCERPSGGPPKLDDIAGCFCAPAEGGPCLHERPALLKEVAPAVCPVGGKSWKRSPRINFQQRTCACAFRKRFDYGISCSGRCFSYWPDKTTLSPELLDQLLANYSKPEDLTGEDGLFKQLKKALIERALGAELTEHLGYEKGDPAGRRSGNSRNGTSSKTLLTEDGEVEISVPRDRAGTFEPQLVAKGQTRFDGFDDKILSLYARGMTVREIQGHLRNSTASTSRPI